MIDSDALRAALERCRRRRCAARLVPVLKPCSPTRACPSSSSTTTTWPPRCAPACWAAASPAPTTSPANGEITFTDLADALGWYTLPMPELAGDAAAELVARCPFLPGAARGSRPCACRC